MAKLNVGNKLPDFTFTTPYETNRDIYTELAKANNTALVFLRYYGCPFCQLDMHEYEIHFDEITATGGQFFVVLQSDPLKLRETLKDHKFPYEIICDPDQKLYQQFSIELGREMKDIIGPNTMQKRDRVKAAGYTHGDYEGIETQLPATFCIDKTGTVTYADYPQYVDASATVEQLKEILN